MPPREGKRSTTRACTGDGAGADADGEPSLSFATSELDQAADVLEMRAIATDFREAVEFVMSDPTAPAMLSDQVQGQLYGLFMCAKEGVAPASFPREGKMYEHEMQYNAHKDAGQMEKHDAMQAYVALIIDNIPDYIFGDLGKPEPETKPGSDLPDNMKAAVKDQLGIDPDAPADGAPDVPPDRLSFHAAVTAGNLDRINSLITSQSAKELVNLRDDDGLTPLMLAADRGQVAVIDLLLSFAELDINLVDGEKQTALHYAVVVECTAAVAKLAPKSQLDLQDDDGLTPLESAKSAGSTAIVELLTAAVQA